MSEQSEALRLADKLDRLEFDEPHGCAAELRRLHAENEALRVKLLQTANERLKDQHGELKRLAAVSAEVEALRADAERYRWLREYLISHRLLGEMFCTPGPGEQPDYWWVLWPSYAVDRRKAPLGYATTPDAAIDAAKERT